MLNDDDLMNLGVRAMGDRKYLLHMFENAKESEKVIKIIQNKNLKKLFCQNKVITCQNLANTQLDNNGNDKSSDDIYHVDEVCT